MKHFFDTEFIENGKTIELLSIGIVNENDDRLYLELDVDTSSACDWVKDNVLPSLTETVKYTREQARDKVLDFCGKDPEFWAYYASYDWVVFCQLFGRMIDLPKGYPMYCNDLKQEIDRKGISNIPINDGNHNALSDALWVKDFYDEIVKS